MVLVRFLVKGLFLQRPQDQVLSNPSLTSGMVRHQKRGHRGPIVGRDSGRRRQVLHQTWGSQTLTTRLNHLRKEQALPLPRQRKTKSRHAQPIFASRETILLRQQESSITCNPLRVPSPLPRSQTRYMPSRRKLVPMSRSATSPA